MLSPSPVRLAALFTLVSLAPPFLCAAPAQDLTGTIWAVHLPYEDCQLSEYTIGVHNSGSAPALNVTVDASGWVYSFGDCDGGRGDHWDSSTTPALASIPPGGGVTLQVSGLVMGPTTLSAVLAADGLPPVTATGWDGLWFDCAAPDSSTLGIVDLDGGRLLPGDRIRVEVAVRFTCWGAGNTVVPTRVEVPVPGLIDLLPDCSGVYDGASVVWDPAPTNGFLSFTARIDPALPVASLLCLQGRVVRTPPPLFAGCSGLYLTDDVVTGPGGCPASEWLDDATCRWLEAADGQPPSYCLLADLASATPADPYFPDARLGDLDGDGDLDLLALGRDGSGGPALELRSWVNDGAGRFSLLATAPVPAAKPIESARQVAADLDGDGRVDAAVACAGGGEYGLWVFRNLGDGRFGPPDRYPLDAFTDPPGLFAVDTDGVPGLDLVLINPTSDVVATYPNLGGATFGSPETSPISATSEASAATTGDFDGDGLVDLAIPNRDPGLGLAVYLGDGSGRFPLAVPSAIGAFTGRLAAGDFVPGGGLDLVAADGGVVVLAGAGDGSFSAAATRRTADYARAVARVPHAIADQFVVAEDTGVELMDPAGTLARELAGRPVHATLDVGDVDGDGQQDVVVMAASCTYGPYGLPGAPAYYVVQTCSPVRVLLRDDTLRSLDRSQDPLAVHLPLDRIDDVYLAPARTGESDPDPLVANATRPLVFYGLDGDQALHLVKSGDRVRFRF